MIYYALNTSSPDKKVIISMHDHEVLFAALFVVDKEKQIISPIIEEDEETLLIIEKALDAFIRKDIKDKNIDSEATSYYRETVYSQLFEEQSKSRICDTNKQNNIYFFTFLFEQIKAVVLNHSITFYRKIYIDNSYEWVEIKERDFLLNLIAVFYTYFECNLDTKEPKVSNSTDITSSSAPYTVADFTIFHIPSTTSLKLGAGKLLFVFLNQNESYFLHARTVDFSQYQDSLIVPYLENEVPELLHFYHYCNIADVLNSKQLKSLSQHLQSIIK